MSEVEEQVQGEGGAPGADAPMSHEGAPPVPPAAEPEAAPRERREYVVLVGERALLESARNALHELLHQKVDDGAPEQAKIAEVVEALAAGAFWGELGRVSAFNRAGALEEIEKRWPSALEGTPRLHLIPARFWQEVTPEEQPPPPPRRKWKGV